MVISGANNLYNNKNAVDELNVFPVPDGDTGTNMSLTAQSMANELADAGDLTLTKAADKMSFATLRGARGNSGVIMSQFFRGISRSFKGKTECGAAELASALKDGSDAAYKAVMNPTEGTILTVAREAAAGAAAAAESGDVVSVVETAVERGSKALERTTEMLPVLKQAGVVDAGGQGWIYVLEGMLSYLQSGEITAKIGGDEAAETKKTAQAAVSGDDIKFKYCTEFIIEKYESGASVDDFRAAIADKGDCQLVIDDDEVCKVHIHTNHPGFVLEEAVKIGEMINLKIDNMKHQHREIIKGSLDLSDGKTPSTVADGKKSKPKKEKEPKPKKEKEPKPKKEAKQEPPKPFGFAAVCAGKGLAEILTDMGVDRIIEGGQTMNPSTDDIVKAVKKVKAQTVFVFPNNKNIIMAAQQAAQILEDRDIVVIESTSYPQCVSAMVAFNDQKDAEANANAMRKAIGKVATAQLTYAVRDTEIDGKTIKKNDILGMVEGKITRTGTDLDEVLAGVVAEITDEDTEIITVYCGKDIKKQQADRMQKALEAKYESDEIEVSFKRGGQPIYYYIVSAE